jgi:hypothetical protein
MVPPAYRRSHIDFVVVMDFLEMGVVVDFALSCCLGLSIKRIAFYLSLQCHLR